MHIKKVIKNISRSVLKQVYNSLFNRPIGEVLMLHRIGDWDDDRLECLEELKVSTKRLQRYIDEKRGKYDFISIDELQERITNQSKYKRPFACFTFDDGYRDNYTIGLPFFEKNEIPFTVFVSTGFLAEKPEFNFPFILERMIKKNNSMEIEGMHYNCTTHEEKIKTFVALRTLVFSWPYEGLKDRFFSTFDQYITPDCMEDLIMNKDELRQLAQSPYCTIGAHTMTHAFLCNVPKDKLHYELIKSRDKLSKFIGKDIKYIAYPYGAYSDDVLMFCEENNFELGFNAGGGAIRRLDTSLFAINRVMMYENK